MSQLWVNQHLTEQGVRSRYSISPFNSSKWITQDTNVPTNTLLLVLAELCDTVFIILQSMYEFDTENGKGWPLKEIKGVIKRSRLIVLCLNLSEQVSKRWLMAHKEMILLEEDIFVIPLNILGGGVIQLFKHFGKDIRKGFLMLKSNVLNHSGVVTIFFLWFWNFVVLDESPLQNITIKPETGTSCPSPVSPVPC